MSKMRSYTVALLVVLAPLALFVMTDRSDNTDNAATMAHNASHSGPSLGYLKFRDREIHVFANTFTIKDGQGKTLATGITESEFAARFPRDHEAFKSMLADSKHRRQFDFIEQTFRESHRTRAIELLKSPESARSFEWQYHDTADGK